MCICIFKKKNIVADVSFCVLQARPRKPPDGKSEQPRAKSSHLTTTKARDIRGATMGVNASTLRDVALVAAATPLAKSPDGGSSSSSSLLLQDQDVPDLDDSLEDSLVTPAAKVAKEGGGTAAPEGESNDSLQEIDEADLAALLPDVNSSAEQTLLGALDPTDGAAEDVEDALHAALMQDIEKGPPSTDTHRKDSPPKPERVRERERGAERSHSHSSSKSRRDHGKHHHHHHRRSSGESHHRSDSSSHGHHQHSSGGHHNSSGHHKSRDHHRASSSSSSSHTSNHHQGGSEAAASHSREPGSGSTSSNTAKNQHSRWSPEQVPFDSGGPESLDTGQVKQRTEKVKRKRGRPPRKEKEGEPLAPMVVVAPPPPESQYDPPEPLLRMDHASNVSPDSGIQSIAGSPTNNDSPSPSHAPPAMPVPTPQSHTHGDIPDLDLPTMLGADLSSEDRHQDLAPTLSPQHPTSSAHSPRKNSSQGVAEKHDLVDLTRDEADQTEAGVSHSKAETGAAHVSNKTKENSVDSDQRPPSVLSKAEKKNKRSGRWPEGKPRLMPVPRVVSETISEKTTVDPAYDIERQYFTMPTLTRTDTTSLANNNNKDSNEPELVLPPKPRRGRPPKNRKDHSDQLVGSTKSSQSESLFSSSRTQRNCLTNLMDFTKQRVLNEREPILNQLSEMATSPFGIQSQLDSVGKNHISKSLSSTSSSFSSRREVAPSTDIDGVGDLVKKKRRPGRPRKHPLPESAATNSSSTSNCAPSPSKTGSVLVRSSSLPFTNHHGPPMRTHQTDLGTDRAHSGGLQQRPGLAGPGHRSVLAPSLLSAGVTARPNRTKSDDFELHSILQSVHASIDTQFSGLDKRLVSDQTSSSQKGSQIPKSRASHETELCSSNRSESRESQSSVAGGHKSKPSEQLQERSHSGKSTASDDHKSGPSRDQDASSSGDNKSQNEDKPPKKIVPKIRKPKLHVMMRRPKKRGRKKKKVLEELSDLTKIVPAVVHVSKLATTSGKGPGKYEKPPTLQAPALLAAAGGSGVTIKASPDCAASDSGIATDSSGPDADKVPTSACSSTTLTMPVLSPVKKDFFPPFPGAAKPVLKAEECSQKKKKKKMKHFKSKHKNIVDPVFLADLDMMTCDLKSLLISQDGPAIPSFMKEEVPLPTIFQLNRQILRRKRGKERHLGGAVGKIRRLESRREMDLSLLKEKGKRGRKKKLISDSSLDMKDEDADEGEEDVSAVNSEQCLPLKKRHKLFSAAAAAQLTDATQETIEQVTPEFLKMAPATMPKPPEKRKVGRPRKHPLPEQQVASPKQGNNYKCSVFLLPSVYVINIL